MNNTFAGFDDETKANIFLKCFNKYFTNREGMAIARQLQIMDYPDFIGLLQETKAICKTSLGGYWINRHFL